MMPLDGQLTMFDTAPTIGPGPTQLAKLLAVDQAGATDDELLVAKYLIYNCKGEAGAIPADKLAAYTGLTRRALRSIIHSLIISRGLPVVTKYLNKEGGKGSGYFIPQSADEAERCTRPLISHALNMLKRASRLRNSPRLAEICGQLEMMAGGD